MTIQCMICQIFFKKMITNTHLKKHNVDLKEYKKIYGINSIISNEYRKERSIAYSGKNNPNYGRKMSKESKELISIKNSGKIPWNKGKKLDKLKKENLIKGIKQREKKYELGEIIRPRTGITLSNEIKKKISEGIKSYAKNNSELLSIRAHKAIKTKIKKGYDIAFFRGKIHTKESIEKIQNSLIKSRRLRRKKINEQYAIKIFDNNLILLNNIDDHFLKLKCIICKTEFFRTRQVFQDSKRNKQKICDICFPKMSKHSDAEIQIFDFIKSLIPNNNIILGDRSLIYPLEIDILIPSLKIAIEYCGLYWHSELNGKDKLYHLYKMNQCIKKGYTLITIFEDELIYKEDILKSRLSFLLNKTLNKIYARKCNVKEISSKEANIFLNQNHLQGSGRSNVRIGLFNNDLLVSVMTFSESNVSRKISNLWELNRFCSICDYSIIGGAGKLFKFFLKTYKPNEIITYADKRWSSGELYKNLGFDKENDTPPNYWYINGDKRKHRFSLRKNKNDNQLLTEWQNRKDQGWNRIWDCGHLRFRWIFN